MCFVIEKNYRKQLKAKEDIVCYKVLRHIQKDRADDIRITSLFWNFTYTVGGFYTKYRLRKDTNIRNLLTIRRNFKVPKTITNGFHSYIDYLAAKKWKWSDTRFIYKCIIPKGAKYYIAPDAKEYVSTKIKIVELI